MTAPVIIAGGGVAGVAVARSLRRSSYDGPITLLAGENEAPYDKPPLSKNYLTGSLCDVDVRLFGKDEVDALDLTVDTASRAVGFDTHRRLLALSDGREIEYAALAIATGAGSRRLHLGDGLAGVHYLRSLADAAALRTSLEGGGRLVVVGAGFIGLEVAATARTLGLEVTVLESAPLPLTRVLGLRGGEVVVDLHRDRGVELRFGVEVLAVEGDTSVRRVAFRGGDRVETLSTETVVIGVGAIPRTAWAQGSGVEIDNGVLCDAGGRTSAPGVYAAGDVSRWRNELTGTQVRVEQWQSATEQGGIVGANIASDLGVPGATGQVWRSVPYFWSDQYDHKVQFCGTPGAITRARHTQRGWVACYGDADDGVLSGVLSIDNPAAVARGRRHVASRLPWTEAIDWIEAL